MSDWQEKIIAAKREGDQLKEKIRQKKDDLNDADRNSPIHIVFCANLFFFQSEQWQGIFPHYLELP
jgi:hypothetical protein